MKPIIRITTGTYNTSDFKIVRELKNKKSALKFLRQIGFVHNEIFITNWSFSGKNYTLSLG